MIAVALGMGEFHDFDGGCFIAHRRYPGALFRRAEGRGASVGFSARSGARLVPVA